MRRMMRIQVLMAGQYPIPRGKRVVFTFHEENNLYYAESDGKVFGLAQALQKGNEDSLQELGKCFAGCVVKTKPLVRKVIVKVPMKGGQSL